LFMPLDLANRRSIASRKSALLLPIVRSNGRCSEAQGQGPSGLTIAASGKMGAAPRLGVSAPTRRGAS
jgi:hypothetical protein